MGDDLVEAVQSFGAGVIEAGDGEHGGGGEEGGGY